MDYEWFDQIETDCESYHFHQYDSYNKQSEFNTKLSIQSLTYLPPPNKKQRNNKQKQKNKEKKSVVQFPNYICSCVIYTPLRHAIYHHGEVT